jgi:hypothetical protein
MYDTSYRFELQENASSTYGFTTVMGLDGLVPFVLEHGGQNLAVRGVIVSDQYLGHFPWAD